MSAAIGTWSHYWEQPAPLPVVKVCSCGCALTGEAWAALPFVGVVDDGVDRIELRNHDCGSTVAIELSPGEGE